MSLQTRSRWCAATLGRTYTSMIDPTSQNIRLSSIDSTTQVVLSCQPYIRLTANIFHEINSLERLNQHYRPRHQKSTSLSDASVLDSIQHQGLILFALKPRVPSPRPGLSWKQRLPRQDDFRGRRDSYGKNTIVRERE